MRVRTFVLVLLLAACRASAPPPPPVTAPAPVVAPVGPLKDRPEMAWWRKSMEDREQRMGWFREARFGMFIHWGVYSLAGGVWKDKPVEGYAEHLMRKEALPLSVYKAELAGKFNPTQFDADEWVAAAKRAGMGYLIITSKHHDGFAMYDSAVSTLDIVDATPWKRDPMLALKEACKRQGVRFGFYYSHARDWSDGPVEGWDKDRKRPADEAAWARQYVDSKAIPQVRELIAKYDPDIFWFDTPEKLSVEENLRILRAAREAKPTLVVNGRLAQVTPDGPPARYGDYRSTTDKPAEFPPHDGDWEAIPTTNESYGWHRMDASHKSSAHFVRLLAKAAARGGNVLLNIGPMGNGKFDPRDSAILEGVGAWMQVNAESIHGTERSPLPVQAWGESTRKGNKLYLHVLEWPRKGRIVVGGLKSRVARAYLLSDPKRAVLEVARAGDLDVVIQGPEAAPDRADTVIALELEDALTVDGARLLSTDVQLDTLRAFDGQLAGGLKFGRGKVEDAFVEGWRSPSAVVRWPVRVREKAVYDVTVAYDAGKSSAGGTFGVKVGDKVLAGKVLETPKQPVKVGRVTLEPGNHEVAVRATKIQGDELLRLRAVNLALVQRGPNLDGAPAERIWGYDGCDKKTLPYSYPKDPAKGFPPGSCPPPADLALTCPRNSQLKFVQGNSSTWEKGYVHPPAYAIDGFLDSRWSTHSNDNEWLVLDFGRSRKWKRLYLVWELAHGSQYEILTSDDQHRWSVVHREKNSDGFTDVIDAEGQGRYLKIQGQRRGKVGAEPLYGYSLFEVIACGENAEAPKKK